MQHNPGIGATPDLSLRVSVATLVRVVFNHPLNGERMVALEQKGTLHETENGRMVEIRSQPFGGAIRILDLNAMHALIGDFHFDSTGSRTEQDFRIFIQPSSWPVLRQFCIQHLSRVDGAILETDPARELFEEFHDALKISLQPAQYVKIPIATIVENEATPTENIHTKGLFTVRVYRVFEAYISDSTLANSMLNNSESHTDQDLSQLALVDLQNGGKGRTNAVLVLPLKQLTEKYSSIEPKERNRPILFEKHCLNETVPAILEDITVPKYQRM